MFIQSLLLYIKLIRFTYFLLSSFEIRSIKVNNYLLFFSIEEDEKEIKDINIITFMYSKRDWIKILSEKPLNKIMQNEKRLIPSTGAEKY